MLGISEILLIIAGFFAYFYKLEYDEPEGNTLLGGFFISMSILMLLGALSYGIQPGKDFVKILNFAIFITFVITVVCVVIGHTGEELRKMKYQKKRSTNRKKEGIG